MTTETSDDRATLSIDRVLMRDVGAAADRAGMAPDDVIELALERWLAEVEPDDLTLVRRRAASETAAERIFFDWSR